MKLIARFHIFWIIIASLFAVAPSHISSQTENAIRHVHDPCIIKEGNFYYIFSTGEGIPMRRSKDLVQWEMVGRVFKEDLPAWAAQDIPGSKGIWAPDIAFFNNRFHLYYSVSTFGKNRSAIGLVTNKTLDPASPEYQWVDAGKVVESFPNNDFNAIDANLVQVTPDKVALSFGSFWSGIKFIDLDYTTGKPAPNAGSIFIARRPPPGAIEAPFIFKRGQYFYLLVSFDVCCKGAASTYNIRIGRARQVNGPYVDRDGKSLLEGGGTLLLAGQDKVIGPGHCDVLQDEKGDFLVHHFYDGAQNYVPTLQIRPLTWDADGWPVAGAPLAAGAPR